MDIKKALSFVTGAVARKEYEPQLCHLLIKDRTAIAYDGLLTMSSPIAIELHIKPNARDLMLAVKECEKTDSPMAMHVTGTGRLSIKAGKFKAFVQCLDNESIMERPVPTGEYVAVTPELFETIKTLAPFMATDASRPWAMGMLIAKNSCLVTNNVILIERWHGSNFPIETIIPAPAINELLRIGECPSGMRVSENSATFYFEDDRWMRTALLEGSWPTSQVQTILSKPSSPVAIPPGFWEALETLRPFADPVTPRVHLQEGKMSTHLEAEEGAEVELDTGPGHQIFTIPYLLSLEDIALKIDWMQHPDPCVFYGNKLRGVIIGIINNAS